MEVVLEGSEGVPRDCILSLKLGATKKQTPISKLGQQFRFSSSPAEPMPLKVELYVPAAPAQLVSIDPAAKLFDVDFGKMKVMFSRREIRDQRAPLSVESAAEAHGLPSEKLHSAQKAAAYLERHDIVKTFQDILRGLLVSAPDEPYSYVEEHIARAKTLSAARTVRQHEDKVADIRRGVDKVLQLLETERKNLHKALPLLPKAVYNEATSEKFVLNCQKRFAELDKDGDGMLKSTQVVSEIENIVSATLPHLSGVGSALTREQCERFVQIFDLRKDGVLRRDEFVDFARFSSVVSYLHSERGKEEAAEALQVLEDCVRVEELLATMRRDKSEIAKVVPYLPATLRNELQGEQFIVNCASSFRELDKDGSKTLDPEELYPLVLEFSHAHKLSLDIKQCRAFMEIWDEERKGVISEGDFVNIVRYMLIMSYLSSQEGEATLTNTFQRPDEHGNTSAGKSPTSVVENSASAVAGNPAPVQQDKTPNTHEEKLPPEEGEKTSATQGEKIGTIEEGKDMPAIGGNEETAPSMEGARALTTQGGEVFPLKQEATPAAKSTNEKSVDDVLMLLEKDRRAIQKVLPLLPKEVIAELFSDAFVVECDEMFVALDKNQNGSLGIEELPSVIANLTSTKATAVTPEQCKAFIAMFNFSEDGVLRQHEFLDFLRFMCVMNFLHSEEGRTKAQGALQIMEESRHVDDLLAMLESDKTDIFMVLPYLPESLQRFLGSPRFSLECKQRFKELDADGSGTLDGKELFPVVMEFSNAHELSLDVEQCEKFMELFDTQHDGVINEDDFAEAARFLMIMSFLRSQEGKAVLSNVLEAEPAAQASPDGDAVQSTNASDKSHVPRFEEPLPMSRCPSTASTTTRYRGKATEIEAENCVLRTRLQQLEEFARHMEGQVGPSPAAAT